ncbi:hypothetical protein E1B28_006609 [Marasmius oreades]|uniref:WD repeat-containing protein JIP5 n=1 Tax=Marasmius oreades TaxID=181124 RepID=A0A9P8AAV0_9AGAR|nr:uncharacterized protein E1B28_006609 [Marasmius oreades]KAG7095925.1 hypothetical protein E1B28_006609 [Marasmius oreades]
MTEISVGSQIFDLVFHPTQATLYTALLSGEVTGISYNQKGKHQQQFSIKVSPKSCRAVTLNEDGTKLYVAGKGKGIHTIDTETCKVVERRLKAHESPINRIKHVQPWLFSTGDDDGVIKLWDPRTKESMRTYKHHFDYITDFLWLPDTKHLVSTSGDGTLSVLDIRSKKTEPFAHSEDQEDELLSLLSIKGGTKVIVGTQIGVLSVFNRSSGWRDCVDRIPGHPHSVEALCSLPSRLPNVDSSSTILTGSSDGFLRAVDIFPTRLRGVVADHGEWPVERIAVGEISRELTLDDNDDGGDKAVANQEDEDSSTAGLWWAGSVGHDEVLKLTDLGSFFAQESASEDGNEDEQQEGEDPSGGDGEDNPVVDEDVETASEQEPSEDCDSDDQDERGDWPKKRKRKDKDPKSMRNRKAKRDVEVQGRFFDDL